MKLILGILATLCFCNAVALYVFKNEVIKFAEDARAEQLQLYHLRPRIGELRIPARGRSPASLNYKPYRGRVRTYYSFICRGPYGRYYFPEDNDFQACLNSEREFENNSPYSGKGFGFHFIVND